MNSYRAYFPIDEEIVTDTDDIFDRDAWVKDEAVNEYNAIEIEMTTNLPVVTAYDLENGEFTMNFHEVLDHELVLDENTADFSVYIGEQEISTAYYRITFDDDTGDDCNFHVDVDLTALYNDGIVTEDMLDGNTEITIFFFADLEGTGLNGSYTSTIWYDIYDGDEWLYTSNESVVAVYTYEIEILKYDSETNDPLAGATLGVYYDEDCTDPVIRNGEPYTAISDEDGMVIFYGLADGTYYVSEIAAPTGYEISDEVLEVELGADLNDTGYTYEGEVANTPKEPGLIDIGGYKIWSGDEESDRPDSITIHLLANGTEVDSKTVTAADGWKWSFTDLDECDEDDNAIIYAITEDEVDGYTTDVSGYNVINTYTTDKTDEPNPTPYNGGNGGNGGTGGTGGNGGTSSGTGNTSNPTNAQNSKTADADLPILPIGGCFAAIALIAVALVMRRRSVK